MLPTRSVTLRTVEQPTPYTLCSVCLSTLIASCTIFIDEFMSCCAPAVQQQDQVLVSGLSLNFCCACGVIAPITCLFMCLIANSMAIILSADHVVQSEARCLVRVSFGLSSAVKVVSVGAMQHQNYVPVRAAHMQLGLVMASKAVLRCN